MDNLDICTAVVFLGTLSSREVILKDISQRLRIQRSRPDFEGVEYEKVYQAIYSLKRLKGLLIAPVCWLLCQDGLLLLFFDIEFSSICQKSLKTSGFTRARI